jgi:DNA polymerase/3'-5' exonuclease PolX
MRKGPIIGDQKENVGLLGLGYSLENGNVKEGKQEDKIFHKLGVNWNLRALRGESNSIANRGACR